VVSVKATSVIFFLGVGGFVCYKLYHYYWPKNPPDSPDKSSPSAKRKAFSSAGTLSNLYQSRRQLIEPGEDAAFGSVHVRLLIFLPEYYLNNLLFNEIHTLKNKQKQF